MKKVLGFLAIFAMFVTASCNKTEEKVAEPVAPSTAVQEQQTVQSVATNPVVQTKALNAMKLKKYNYFAAPMDQAATGVVVDYTTPYKSDVSVKFMYADGSTYTYTIAKTYGLWANLKTGKYKVVTDDQCTVWLQGSTYSGGYHEFVFYGDPKNNGKKIKPSSFKNLPAGQIVYRK